MVYSLDGDELAVRGGSAGIALTGAVDLSVGAERAAADGIRVCVRLDGLDLRGGDGVAG